MAIRGSLHKHQMVDYLLRMARSFLGLQRGYVVLVLEFNAIRGSIPRIFILQSRSDDVQRTSRWPVDMVEKERAFSEQRPWTMMIMMIQGLQGLNLLHLNVLDLIISPGRRRGS